MIHNLFIAAILLNSCPRLHANSVVEVVEEEDLKLEYVQIVWRHGDRAPDLIYPTDPNADFWPQGRGALTQKGMKQHYVLGEYLRQRYVPHLVSEHYLQDETYIISSHVDRAIQSAEANLASFYKPSDWQIFEPDLDWQPVPIHTLPKSLDHMLDPNFRKCPKWVAIDQEFQQSDKFQSLNASNQDLFANLTKLTGTPIDMQSVGLLNDNFICTQAHDLDLPDWATPEILETASELDDYVFLNVVGTKQQQRLLGGALLKSVRDTFQTFVEGNYDSLPSQKLLLYSGHDTTTMALTNLLDVFNHQIVPYAAAVIMELFSSEDNKFYVRFSYHNESNQDPYVLEMKLCGYQEFCDWDVFYANTKNLTLEDWDRECEMDDTNDNLKMLELIAIIAGGVLVLVGFALFIFFCCIKKRRGKLTTLGRAESKHGIEFSTASNTNLLSNTHTSKH